MKISFMWAMFALLSTGIYAQDLRENGSIFGRVESNGDVRISGSIKGRIESNGDVRKNGSVVGSAKGVRPEFAAVIFFFDFFSW
jgi:hypothetical protein